MVMAAEFHVTSINNQWEYKEKALFIYYFPANRLANDRTHKKRSDFSFFSLLYLNENKLDEIFYYLYELNVFEIMTRIRKKKKCNHWQRQSIRYCWLFSFTLMLIFEPQHIQRKYMITNVIDKHANMDLTFIMQRLSIWQWSFAQKFRKENFIAVIINNRVGWVKSSRDKKYIDRNEKYCEWKWGNKEGSYFMNKLKNSIMCGSNTQINGIVRLYVCVCVLEMMWQLVKLWIGCCIFEQ